MVNTENKKLFGHTSLETAYKVDNYPYGFKLRTSIFYWIETTPKLGDRFCSATLNPKNGKMNAPKKSTYYALMYMFLNADNHVKFTCVHKMDMGSGTVVKFAESMGIENMNKEQIKRYNELMGINEVKTDEFTGEVKKDFSVKWERETIGAGWENGKWNKGEKGNYIEVKITFDRPDGVKLIEIYKAMKTLNQEKLNQVFAERPSISSGTKTGVVRICCRGGVYLGQVYKSDYEDYLASDANVTEDNK